MSSISGAIFFCRFQDNGISCSTPVIATTCLLTVVACTAIAYGIKKCMSMQKDLEELRQKNIEAIKIRTVPQQTPPPQYGISISGELVRSGIAIATAAIIWYITAPVTVTTAAATVTAGGGIAAYRGIKSFFRF